MAEKSEFPDAPPEIGKFTVERYYEMLQTRPDDVHQFYRDESTIVRTDGKTRESATTRLQKPILPDRTTVSQGNLDIKHNYFVLAEGQSTASESCIQASPNPIGRSYVWEDEYDTNQVSVKNVPTTMSANELADKFQKFGNVEPHGVTIVTRRRENDVCESHAYVEFEHISGVKNAIQASVVKIGGHELYVEPLLRPK